VPIVIDGQVVGAIGVSGAMSAQQDDDIATVAANAAGATSSSATAGAAAAAQPDRVVSIEAAKTSAAFEKGHPLLETAACKGHASRREAAGMAEVHARD